MVFIKFSIFLLFCFVQGIINDKNDCTCDVNRSKYSQNLIQKNVFTFKETEVSCSRGIKDVYPSNKIKDVDSMILIPRGNYQVGTDDIVINADNEGPKRIVEVKSFYIDKFEVSNKDYAEFVEATGYKSEAETFGDSFVFSLFLNNTVKENLKDFRVRQAPWWYKVTGANWRHPHGSGSDISEVLNHPVIHVSWKDAQAFCNWRNSRLPSEAEWEAACRGGHKDTKYPWGDKLYPNRIHMANIWQGTFPNYNSMKDGYIGTNPVDQFTPNDFGLYNMAGNVWEWVQDSWSPESPNEKVKKGGSYLCHRSYCYRYRCSARSHNTDDSSAGNLGFRCAKSL